MIRLNKKVIMQYVLIYWMFQFLDGRIAIALGSDIFMIVSLLLGGGYILIHFPSMDKNIKGFIGGLVISLGVTILLTRGGLSPSSSLSLLARFFVVYAAMDVDRENFVERLVKIVYVFAIISLFTFAFSQIVGVDKAISLVFSHLYEIKNINTWLRSSYGLILFCVNYVDPLRNAYMFGEVGLYQMVIMLAMYYLVYKSNMTQKRRKKYLIVFLVTMLTTQSTTGFFSLLVFVLVVLFDRSEKINTKIKAIIMSATLIAVIYFVFLASADSFIFTKILSKITDSSGSLDLTVSTGADRVGAILSLGRAIKEIPLELFFGVGYTGLVATIGQFSCSGIVNSIIMFGWLSCILFYVFLFSGAWKGCHSVYEFLFLAFMIINNGLSQPNFLAITAVIVGMQYWVIDRRYVKYYLKG